VAGFGFVSGAGSFSARPICSRTVPDRSSAPVDSASQACFGDIAATPETEADCTKRRDRRTEAGCLEMRAGGPLVPEIIEGLMRLEPGGEDLGVRNGESPPPRLSARADFRAIWTNRVRGAQKTIRVASVSLVPSLHCRYCLNGDHRRVVNPRRRMKHQRDFSEVLPGTIPTATNFHELLCFRDGMRCLRRGAPCGRMIVAIRFCSFSAEVPTETTEPKVAGSSPRGVL
jgi:hypothetical protein